MNSFKDVPIDVIKYNIIKYLFGRDALSFLHTCRQFWLQLYPDPIDRYLYCRGSRNVVKVKWHPQYKYTGCQKCGTPNIGKLDKHRIKCTGNTVYRYCFCDSEKFHETLCVLRKILCNHCEAKYFTCDRIDNVFPCELCGREDMVYGCLYCRVIECKHFNCNACHQRHSSCFYDYNYSKRLCNEPYYRIGQLCYQQSDISLVEIVKTLVTRVRIERYMLFNTLTIILTCDVFKTGNKLYVVLLNQKQQQDENTLQAIFQKFVDRECYIFDDRLTSLTWQLDKYLLYYTINTGNKDTQWKWCKNI